MEYDAVETKSDYSSDRDCPFSRSGFGSRKGGNCTVVGRESSRVEFRIAFRRGAVRSSSFTCFPACFWLTLVETMSDFWSLRRANTSCASLSTLPPLHYPLELQLLPILNPPLLPIPSLPPLPISPFWRNRKDWSTKLIRCDDEGIRTDSFRL